MVKKGGDEEGRTRDWGMKEEEEIKEGGGWERVGRLGGGGRVTERQIRVVEVGKEMKTE